MTGSVALDIIIGLVFVYLLYSLLTSLIAEIIATNLGLRARNLHSALCRMLDEEEVVSLVKNRDASGLVNQLYEHPEIKSLAPNRFFSKPSSIPSDTFARALVDTLKTGHEQQNFNDIKKGIKSYKLPSPVESYLLNLAENKGQETPGFSEAVEKWFDNTMYNATEWYKRNMQIMLFLIGLLLAWVFNVDTISISQKLAVDKDARDQLVQLASSHIQNRSFQSQLDSSGKINSAEHARYKAKMDSLVSIKNELIRSIDEAQSVIGGGTWLPDTLWLGQHGTYPSGIESSLLPHAKTQNKRDKYYLRFSLGDRIHYAVYMFFNNIAGYLITAIALSLGAPFWFDVLNRVMKLRSAIAVKNK